MKRLSTIHKCEVFSRYFQAIKTGEKDFLITFDDKDFLVGDTVIFHAWEKGKQTGETTKRKIKYILRSFKGLQYGYLVLGFEQLLDKRSRIRCSKPEISV